MKINSLLALTGAGLLTLAASACSEDDFTSRPPTFNAVRLTKIKAATGTLDDGVYRVGDRVILTLVQSGKGRLLNRVDYTWSSIPEAVHSYEKQSVYDANPESPSDTIDLLNAGMHTVQLKARYSVSGQGAVGATSYGLPGGSVSVSTSTLSVLLNATVSFPVSAALE